MPTLPTGISPGDTGHIGHHDALHAMFDQADGKGELLVATAADTWDNLPAGANDRVLTADNTQALGVRWGDAPISKSLLDAKGDIIAATAADTPDRLAVGADLTVLEADSTTATGIKWGTPPIKAALFDAKGDLIGASAADTPGRLAVGADGLVLTADVASTLGFKWFAPRRYVGAQASAAGAQVIPDSVNTLVTWAVEDDDSDGFFTAGGSAFTVPAGLGGRYWVYIYPAWNGSTNLGAYTVEIWKNGSVVRQSAINTTLGSAIRNPPPLAMAMVLVPTDVITFKAFAPGGQGFGSASPNQAHAGLYLIGTS